MAYCCRSSLSFCLLYRVYGNCPKKKKKKSTNGCRREAFYVSSVYIIDSSILLVSRKRELTSKPSSIDKRANPRLSTTPVLIWEGGRGVSAIPAMTGLTDDCHPPSSTELMSGLVPSIGMDQESMIP